METLTKDGRGSFSLRMNASTVAASATDGAVLAYAGPSAGASTQFSDVQRTIDTDEVVCVGGQQRLAWLWFSIATWPLEPKHTVNPSPHANAVIAWVSRARHANRARNRLSLIQASASTSGGLPQVPSQFQKVASFRQVPLRSGRPQP